MTPAVAPALRVSAGDELLEVAAFGAGAFSIDGRRGLATSAGAAARVSRGRAAGG